MTYSNNHFQNYYFLFQNRIFGVNIEYLHTENCKLFGTEIKQIIEFFSMDIS